MDCVFGEHVIMPPPGGAPVARDSADKNRIARSRRAFARIKQSEEDIDVLARQITQLEKRVRGTEFKVELCLAGIFVMDVAMVILIGMMKST